MSFLRKIVNLFVKKPKTAENVIKATTTVSKNQFSSEVSFDTKEFKLHKLANGPSTNTTINKEDALKYYQEMLGIRRLETASGALYKDKSIRGFCHLYSGQEACAVGMKAALRDGLDDVITAYRCHGWTYLMGASIASVLCELTGHVDGVSRGKGGSMHLYGPNFYGGNGIVGAQVPLGAGLAFAHKYRNSGGVCVALYGDGAANQGQLFEVYNMTKLWDVPCIYVCENNGYGMGTSAERASANTAYYTRGDYIPGIWVDGMDVLAVREATRFAVEHATSGKGPILMEMATYRYSGHSMSDPGTSYRSRDEIQEVRQKRDPITSFKEKILNAGLATDAEFKAIEMSIKKEVEEAVKKAKSDCGIVVEELTTDIYADDTNLKQVRNVLPNSELKHTTLNKAVNL